MDDREPIVQKLQKLSRREREVLRERCQGKLIADIATTLVIVEGTVKHHLGNIYAKLELDHLSSAARNLELPKFCEVLREIPEEDMLPPEPEPEVTPPQPMSLESVLEDELALVQQKQEANQLWMSNPSPPPDDRSFVQDRHRGRRNFLILILAIVIISGLAGAGIMALFFTTRIPVVASPSPIVSLQQPPSPTLTVSPSATPTLVPTITPSSTSTPSPTRPPTPTLTPTVPLTVTFSSGLRNDNFANAVVLNTLPFTDSLNLELATTEVDEPLLCSFGEEGDEYTDHTVWYRFTPTTTVGLVTHMRSEFVAAIIVYSGSSLNSLTRIECVSGSKGREWMRGPLSTPFTGGTTYYLQIGSIFSPTVDIQFELYSP